MESGLTRKGECSKCGKCCRFIRLEYARIAPAAVVFFKMHGCDVRGIGNKMYVDVPVACENVGPDGLCKIYETRPDFCKTYPESAVECPDGCTYKFE